MELTNTFTIDAPIEKAWEALNTPETIAPCFPGATLTEYEGDTFTGTVKVKLGPISLLYKGTGTYRDRDDDTHRVVIDAKGRDSRGNGTAEATVTGTMEAAGDATKVTMVTDMKITGRPAQFGRGVISDVADKIIGQFATCVASKLTSVPAAVPGPAAAQVEVPVAATVSAGATNGASSTATATGPALSSTPVAATNPKPVVSAPRSTAPVKSEIDAIDLLDTAGSPVLRRLVPALGGVLGLALIFLLVRRLRG